MSKINILAPLPNPSLLLDERRTLGNTERLRMHIRGLGVSLRTHLKIQKSVEVARRALTGGTGPSAVSTLKEAEKFAEAEVKDILYAVGIAPKRLPRVPAMRAAGCDRSVVVDSPEQAASVAADAREASDAIPVLIEIDSDGHRSGLRPDHPALEEVGRLLAEGGAELRGVVTHAGESYGAAGAAALAAFAERERRVAVEAAETLRNADLPCSQAT